MGKKILIIIFIIVSFANYSFSYSARSEIHKYGFVALGDDLSTISYNPAGLFYLPKTYGEFIITSDKNFKYNQVALGYYLTHFPLLSRFYWTSVNFSLGMTKIAENEEFSVGLGGTLINFLKYGVLLKYNKNYEVEKNYYDFNIGTIIKLINWCKIGFTAMNIADKVYAPLNYNLGINFIILKGFKLTLGANLDQDFKEISDYSGATEINLLNNFYLLTGIQKRIIPFGLGFCFSLEEYKNYKREKRTRACYRERVFITFNYDKEKGKITKLIVSFNYKFHSFIHSPYIPGKRVIMIKEETYTDEEEEKVMEEEDILEEQKERLEKAKIYFAEERLDDAKEEIEKILKLNRKSKYAREALKLKREINRIEYKIRRLKRKNKKRRRK